MHRMGLAVRPITPKAKLCLIGVKTGAIYAILSYYACRKPSVTFLFFGIVPIPAWMFVPGVLLYDVYEMVASNRVRAFVPLILYLYMDKFSQPCR